MQGLRHLQEPLGKPRALFLWASGGPRLPAGPLDLSETCPKRLRSSLVFSELSGTPRPQGCWGKISGCKLYPERQRDTDVHFLEVK
jgi:hypothetical protein